MHIFLLINPGRISNEEIENIILPQINSLGLTFDIHTEIPIVIPEAWNNKGYQLVITIGGDGTFLSGSRFAQEGNIPILGVMAGTFGFLCSTPIGHIRSALISILENKIARETREVIRAGIINSKGEHTYASALNEIFISKINMGSGFRHYVVRYNGTLVGEYRADGLLFCTPTGSTAYSLSLGGPIVHPEARTLMMTPFAAFSLSARPIIFPDTGEIEVTVADEERSVVNHDNRHMSDLIKGDELFISLSNRRLTVLRYLKFQFFDVLSKKLYHMV